MAVCSRLRRVAAPPPLLAPLLSLLLLARLGAGKLVTIRNDSPKLDVNGNNVDAHDGCIVAHSGVYYLYGEAYANATGGTFPGDWGNSPQLAVYTSPDLIAWTYRGSPLSDETADATKWIPNVLWSEAQQRFIMWGGSGDWFVATSLDGVAFNLETAHTTSRLGGGTDGTGFFIDTDGQGYIAFSWTGAGYDHVTSIERLAPDLLSSSKVNVSGFFPDNYNESPGLFKHGSTYYLTYGSCCCACRGGGGVVVFTAPSIEGPWTRQAVNADVNCANATATICGGFGARTTNRDQLVYNAQWWGPSFIPLKNGTTQVIYTGRRWLSGFANNPDCDDMCGNGGGRGGAASCETPAYLLRSDFDVWRECAGAALAVRAEPAQRAALTTTMRALSPAPRRNATDPLTFNADGSVVPFTALATFTLELPD